MRKDQIIACGVTFVLCVIAGYSLHVMYGDFPYLIYLLLCFMIGTVVGIADNIIRKNKGEKGSNHE